MRISFWASLVSVGLFTAVACFPEDEPVGPTEISRMEAYRCLFADTVCVGRGELIAAGELPPADSIFQVWIWHPGSNTSAWRLLWPGGNSDATLQLAFDSAFLNVDLLGAPEKDYTLRVSILGSTADTTTVVARDSLMWEYP